MKLEKIRLATPEEVERIKDTSDLTPSSRVVAMGDNLAVWRICNEVDPWHFREGASLQEKALFYYSMQNFLLGAGATEFYFNVLEKDEPFRKAVQNLGAVEQSTAPEYRYKVQL